MSAKEIIALMNSRSNMGARDNMLEAMADL
jgi:hypothetical protein